MATSIAELVASLKKLLDRNGGKKLFSLWGYTTPPTTNYTEESIRQWVNSHPQSAITWEKYLTRMLVKEEGETG